MSAVQKKKNRRILQLVALALCFVMFDVAVYDLFTKRYIDHRSDEMKSKSVEVSSNLLIRKSISLMSRKSFRATCPCLTAQPRFSRCTLHS